jgi:hypothetical protein
MSRQYTPAGRKHVLVQESVAELPDTLYQVAISARCHIINNS